MLEAGEVPGARKRDGIWAVPVASLATLLASHEEARHRAAATRGAAAFLVGWWGGQLSAGYVALMAASRRLVAAADAAPTVTLPAPGTPGFAAARAVALGQARELNRIAEDVLGAARELERVRGLEPLVTGLQREATKLSRRANVSPTPQPEPA
jgi:hypothetical protein